MSWFSSTWTVLKEVLNKMLFKVDFVNKQLECFNDQSLVEKRVESQLGTLREDESFQAWSILKVDS